MVERLHVPFPVLSDEKLVLTTALKLPTMVVAGQTMIKRLRVDHRSMPYRACVLSGVSARSERGRRAGVVKGQSGLRAVRPLARSVLTFANTVGTSRASARLCWCCSASNDSCRKGVAAGRCCRAVTERRVHCPRARAPLASYHAPRGRARRSARKLVACLARCGKITSAGVDLGGKGFVLRRHAADRVADTAVDQDFNPSSGRA